MASSTSRLLLIWIFSAFISTCGGQAPSEADAEKIISLTMQAQKPPSPKESADTNSAEEGKSQLSLPLLSLQAQGNRQPLEATQSGRLSRLEQSNGGSRRVRQLASRDGLSAADEAPPPIEATSRLGGRTAAPAPLSGRNRLRLGNGGGLLANAGGLLGTLFRQQQQQRIIASTAQNTAQQNMAALQSLQRKQQRVAQQQQQLALQLSAQQRAQRAQQQQQQLQLQQLLQLQRAGSDGGTAGLSGEVPSISSLQKPTALSKSTRPSRGRAGPLSSAASIQSQLPFSSLGSSLGPALNALLAAGTSSNTQQPLAIRSAPPTLISPTADGQQPTPLDNSVGPLLQAIQLLQAQTGTGTGNSLISPSTSAIPPNPPSIADLLGNSAVKLSTSSEEQQQQQRALQQILDQERRILELLERETQRSQLLQNNRRDLQTVQDQQQRILALLNSAQQQQQQGGGRQPTASIFAPAAEPESSIGAGRTVPFTSIPFPSAANPFGTFIGTGTGTNPSDLPTGRQQSSLSNPLGQQQPTFGALSPALASLDLNQFLQQIPTSSTAGGVAAQPTTLFNIGQPAAEFPSQKFQPSIQQLLDQLSGQQPVEQSPPNNGLQSLLLLLQQPQQQQQQLGQPDQQQILQIPFDNANNNNGAQPTFISNIPLIQSSQSKAGIKSAAAADGEGELQENSKTKAEKEGTGEQKKDGQAESEEEEEKEEENEHSEESAQSDDGVEN